MTAMQATMTRRGLALAAALAAAASALTATLAVPQAGAASLRSCATFISGRVAYNALIIPAGSTCTIKPGAHATISGDVRVERGAKLVIARVEDKRGELSVGGSLSVGERGQLVEPGILTVKDNVTATGPDDVYLLDRTQIGGNLEITGWDREVALAGVSVDGTVSIRDYAARTEPRFGTIDVINSDVGELVLKDNTKVWELMLADNRIARRLDCVADVASRFMFERNTVDGKTVEASACPAP